MKYDLLPGTDGVVRFPTERRARPSLLGIQELAPRSDLAAAMADERAGDEQPPDTMAVVAEAFTTLALTLEFSMGQTAALTYLRAVVEVQVREAHALCWEYRDAEAAAEEVSEKLRAGKASGADAYADGLREQVRRTRAIWTETALAARAAADAALGAQGALDYHELGTPWRRMTGTEHGEWLVEQAKAWERQDEPA